MKAYLQDEMHHVYLTACSGLCMPLDTASRPRNLGAWFVFLPPAESLHSFDTASLIVAAHLYDITSLNGQDTKEDGAVAIAIDPQRCTKRS